MNPRPWRWRWSFSGATARSRGHGKTIIMDAADTVVANVHRHESALLIIGLVNDAKPATEPEGTT